METSSEETLVFEGPWVCYHCGWVCNTRAEGLDHFGYDESEMPTCIVVATETQQAIVEDRRFWKNRALRAEDDLEQAEHIASSFTWDLRSKFKGAKSVTEAWQKYETLEGENLALKEKIEWVPKWIRNLFRPVGYFPE